MKRRATTLGAFAALVLATSAASAPWTPSDDGQVLEVLGDPRDPARRELVRLRAERDRAPGDPQAALGFARRALAHGQRTGDPRWIGEAAAALAPWLAREAPPVEALVLHATVLQNRHEFRAALELLEAALSRDPRNAQAWLTRAAIELVLGEPRAALASCRRLIGRAESLAIATCAGQALGRSGNAERAALGIREALSRAPEAPRELRLWSELELADLALRRADFAAADSHSRAALALDGGDVAALVARADVLLEAGRGAEVRALLEGAPRTDAVLLRLALAPGGEAEASEFEARAHEARLRGASLHAREESRFALHVRRAAERALALALESFAEQREPADARAVLEAALAASDPAAAAEALAWLESTRLEDVSLAQTASALRVLAQ